MRGRAGSGLDPRVAAVFLSLGEQAYAGLDAPSVWEEALAAEPGPQPVIGEDQMDACLSAMADFADLKSMWTIGHSRGVAELAGAAAGAAGAGRGGRRPSCAGRRWCTTSAGSPCLPGCGRSRAR